jgi:ArsR family transcriptional regulator
MKDIHLTQDEERLMRVFNALGNPARFKMFQHLVRCPECYVGEVVDQMPLVQSTVSQHLKVLREAGVIHDEKAGVAKCCTPNWETLLWLRDRIEELVGRIKRGSEVR